MNDTDPLSLTDLENVIQIIDFACEQGAFKGWNTIHQVMGVRERLATKLDEAKKNTEIKVEGDDKK